MSVEGKYIIMVGYMGVSITSAGISSGWGSTCWYI